MKHRLLVILALVLIFIPVSASLATGFDDKGQPNDPAINPRANACFGGGSMEGKCDTEWEWTCGWYLIRYTAGIYSRSQVPAWCLLPPLPAQNATFVGCQPVLGNYVNFGNSNYVHAGVPTYTDANCSTPTGMTTGSVAFVWTSSVSKAAAVCTSHGHLGAGTVVSGQLFYCN